MSIEAESKHFEEFGQLLGECFKKENDLSNITYAVLNVIPEFKRDFINFFLNSSQQLDNIEDITVEREFKVIKKAGDAGRVDLLFYSTDWQLIVENKLGDKNYHFTEYYQDNPDRYYGLIANHVVQRTPESGGWELRTWDNLVDTFKEKSYGEYDSLFKAYISYIREVCSMKDLVRFEINPKALYSLYNFVNMVEVVIKTTQIDGCEIGIQDNNPHNFIAGYSGYYFRLNTPDNKVLYPYFGICYNEEDVSVLVMLEKNWKSNGEYFSAIEKSVRDSTDLSLEVEVYDDLEIYFCCPQETIDQLNASDVDKQKEVLRDFFQKSCTALGDSQP